MGRRMLQVENGRTWRPVRDVICVDLKTPENMWSIDERLAEGGKFHELDGERLMHAHFPQVYSQLKGLPDATHTE